LAIVKPAIFDYHAPAALAEAVALLAEAGPEGRILGGGQSLVPMMNFRIASPAVLIDLAHVPGLDAVSVDPDGSLVIGATATQSRVLAAPETAGWPLLRDAITYIGHPQIRNRGTVCGSLAHHDPAAELPAVAVALDAELTLIGQDGSRTVPAAEFFVSHYETSIRQGEIVASVRFPARPVVEGWGFAEFARKHGDFALVGAAATASSDGVRLVLFGIDERPRRLHEVEAALVDGGFTQAALAEALASLPDLIHPMDDSRGSAEFRRDVAVEMSRVALLDCQERLHA